MDSNGTSCSSIQQYLWDRQLQKERGPPLPEAYFHLIYLELCKVAVCPVQNGVRTTQRPVRLYVMVRLHVMVRLYVTAVMNQCFYIGVYFILDENGLISQVESFQSRLCGFDRQRGSQLPPLDSDKHQPTTFYIEYIYRRILTHNNKTQ
jgi:hypothetical protein